MQPSTETGPSSGSQTRLSTAEQQVPLKSYVVPLLKDNSRRRSQAGLPTTEHPVQKNTSRSRSVTRYAAFVVAIASLTSLVLFVVPAMLISRASTCRHIGGCYSLEQDLLESIDSSVHPCDDFYRHVCHGWEKRHMQQPPARRYTAHFRSMVIWNLLRRRLPRSPHSALDKASSMLLRCVKQSASKGGAALKEFLLDVGLPWPQKSTATRQQMLDLLVKFSLDLGMPTLWKFFIGRHFSKPTENTLYMSLDIRFHGWTQDVEVLHIRGLLHHHLRRAAEMVGGTGKSYSNMIEDVLTTHEQLRDTVRHVETTLVAPQYVSLNDYDLRLAINGHLPDDSQLWIEDTIVDLQPGLFRVLDNNHLRNERALENFKLFLGAYVVWTLSPLLASDLDHAMHVDMGNRQPSLTRKIQDCFASVGHLMPLVSWKAQADYILDKPRAWRLLQLLAKSAVQFLQKYSEEMATRASAVLMHLSLNTLNMTVSWSMLDNIYSFIPATAGGGSYFDLYRRVAQASVNSWKQSIRRPRLNLYNSPDASRDITYRNLVARELAISSSYFVPPLMVPEHPLAVTLGGAGVQMASQIIVLLHVILVYNDKFKADVAALGSLETFFEDLYAFYDHFNDRGKLMGLLDMTDKEILHMVSEGLATLVVSYAVESKGAVTAKPADPKASTKFGAIPPGALFFLVNCFMQCGGAGRSRLLKMAYCNSALQTVRAFSEAFDCTPRNMLATGFYWRKFPHEPEEAKSFHSRLRLEPQRIVSAYHSGHRRAHFGNKSLAH